MLCGIIEKWFKVVFKMIVKDLMEGFGFDGYGFSGIGSLGRNSKSQEGMGWVSVPMYDLKVADCREKYGVDKHVVPPRWDFGIKSCASVLIVSTSPDPCLRSQVLPPVMIK